MLLDAEGREIERWRGFGGVDEFVERLEFARADLATVEEKRRRYETEPDADTAQRLASVHEGRNDYAEAVTLYREAERLDPDRVYAQEIFENQFYGMEDDLFTLDEVRAAADEVLARQGDSAEAMMTVAVLMASQARERADPELFRPYAEPALRLAEGTGIEWVRKLAPRVRIDEAILLDEDPDRALALKRESMGEGWEEDAGKLNEFAWWCFENHVGLAEAEAYARKGAELAEPGGERAMILDTLAEICNALEKCDEAVDAITRAVQEDPDSEYYPKQRDRFAEDCA